MTHYPIFCGAAMRCVDPPKEDLHLLHGPGETFGSILDSVSVRAMALACGPEKVLFVSFENPRSLMPERNLGILEEWTGIPRNHIFYFCTHNHAAVEIRSQEKMRMPVGGPTQEEMDAYYRYEGFLQESMLSAVDEALASLRPARVGWATGESYINCNRISDYEVVEEGEVKRFTGYGVNSSAPVDRALFVLKAEDAEGKPIAFLVNYAIHNVLMHRNHTADGFAAISGDIGGNISQLLEKQFPGSVALWSSGAAGDVQPAFMKTLFAEDPDTGAPQGIGIEDFDAQCALLKATVYRHYADLKETLKKITETYGEAAGITVDEEILEAPSRTEDPFRMRLHLMRMGDLALMGVSGEPFTKLGFLIKNAAPVRDLVLITHDGHRIQNGYTQDDESLRRILSGAPRKRGLPPPRFLPGTLEQELVRGTKRLFARSMYD